LAQKGSDGGVGNCREAAYLNKALHRMAIPLRFRAAGERGRSALNVVAKRGVP